MVPARKSIDAALALLQQAERPLMVIGKGAAIARAEEEIREFVKKTDIPFQPMSMAKGVVPDTDPHSTASCRSTALRNADVVCWSARDSTGCCRSARAKRGTNM